MTSLLFEIRNLTVTLPGNDRAVLQGVNLALAEGDTLALTGPSGCGKSMTARALCGLLPAGARWQGEVWWRGQQLLEPGQASWQAMRGRGAAMVLQEPASSLNPVLRVGDQIAESVALHQGVGMNEARCRAVALLEEVQVPDPAARARWYPHQLSGGMRQRVLLAAALACNPSLLVADEPTTALDPTVQREMLALVDRVRRRRDMALLFISHDLAVVSLMCRRVAFMKAGMVHQVVPVNSHPGDGAILPGVGRVQETLRERLKARGIVAGYGPGGRGKITSAQTPAVRGVDLDLSCGLAVGLAGESGCGKSTLARVLCRQLDPWEGSLTLDGKDLLGARGRDLAAGRRKVQMVFQDPAASLNPRQRVVDALREAAAGTVRPASPEQLLAETGLGPEFLARYPHQMSGGQRQRVAVARCLAADPAVLVADEVTSALDAENRRQLLELFGDLLVQRGIALLLISHDLDLLTRFCQRVLVMKDGVVVEDFPGGDRSQACHPYTRDLLLSSPRELLALGESWSHDRGQGQSDLSRPADGCPWAQRCSLAQPQCIQALPGLVEIAPGHLLRCPEAKASQPSHFIDT